MSASPPNNAIPAVHPELKDLPVAQVRPNEANPRLVFPPEELDRLAESIDLEGILVPIVVYPVGVDEYVLVDGERRFRCAQMLGLETVPALITSKRPEKDLLLQMFNIHLIREPWRDMPTAIALGRLVTALTAAGEDVSEPALRDRTGLSIERVRQLLFVRTLPPEWQDHISSGEIPLNFFWELKKNVTDALQRHRPSLFAQLGGERAISTAFVEKRLHGVITDTVSLRRVRPIIVFAASEADASDASPLDAQLRDLITQSELSIDEVYEDTVQIMVEVDKLERRTRSMLASFQRLLNKARSADEEDAVRTIGKAFCAELTALVGK